MLKKTRTQEDDVAFIKRIHPKTTTDGTTFRKQVFVHSQDKLKRKTIKLKLIHLHNKMKRKALQVAVENAETFLKGKFKFSPKKILNNTILFETSCIDEEELIDKTLEALPAGNNELHVLYEPGSNTFNLKHEDGK